MLSNAVILAVELKLKLYNKLAELLLLNTKASETVVQCDCQIPQTDLSLKMLFNVVVLSSKTQPELHNKKLAWLLLLNTKASETVVKMRLSDLQQTRSFIIHINGTSSLVCLSLTTLLRRKQQRTQLQWSFTHTKTAHEWLQRYSIETLKITDLLV